MNGEKQVSRMTGIRPNNSKKKSESNTDFKEELNNKQISIHFLYLERGGTVEYAVKPAREINSTKEKYTDWVTQRRIPERKTQEIWREYAKNINYMNNPRVPE